MVSLLAAGLADWSPSVWVDPLVVLTMFAVVAGAAGFAWRKVLRPLLLMAIDWHGTPARPGVDRRPSAMERLDALEHLAASYDQHFQKVDAVLKGINGQLGYIYGELSMNGGDSVKDTVKEIARLLREQRDG